MRTTVIYISLPQALRRTLSKTDFALSSPPKSIPKQAPGSSKETKSSAAPAHEAQSPQSATQSPLNSPLSSHGRPSSRTYVRTTLWFGYPTFPSRDDTHFNHHHTPSIPLLSSLHITPPVTECVIFTITTCPPACLPATPSRHPACSQICTCNHGNVSLFLRVK